MKRDATAYTKTRHRKMMSELLDQPKRIQNALKVGKLLKKTTVTAQNNVRLSAAVRLLSS